MRCPELTKKCISSREITKVEKCISSEKKVFNDSFQLTTEFSEFFCEVILIHRKLMPGEVWLFDEQNLIFCLFPNAYPNIKQVPEFPSKLVFETSKSVKIFGFKVSTKLIRSLVIGERIWIKNKK